MTASHFSAAGAAIGDLTTLGLIDLVGNTINAARPPNPIQMPGADRPIFEMYARALRLFRGVATLIAAESYDPAMIVGRSLFEQTLRLMELAEAGPKRTVIILSWAREGIDRDLHLVHVAEQVGLAENVDTLMTAIKRRRQEVAQLQQQLGLGKLRNSTQKLPLAKRLGLGDDYWTYEYMHQVVHGNPTPLGEFLSPGDAGEDFATWVDAEKPGELLYLAALSSKLVLYCHDATAQVFDWNIPPAIPEAMAIAQNVLDQLALASAGERDT